MATKEEENWESVSKMYCDLLEETAKQIRTMTPSIPDKETRDNLVGQIDKIKRLGRVLQDYMTVSDPPRSPKSW